MRTWTRAAIARHCGNCGAAIAVGAPVLELAIPELVQRKVRCPACAGESVPADLPARVDPQTPFLRLVPIPTGAHVLPFDYKSAAAGDREPGEDDQ